MTNIATTSFYIKTKNISENSLEKYSTELFDTWEQYIDRHVELEDYSLSLEIEEGSIKGSARIAAALYAIYMGIGNYGSFVSGVQTISSQIKSASDHLIENAANSLQKQNTKIAKRYHSNKLTRLEHVFEKVRGRKISTEEAMIEAEKIFGEELKIELAFSEALKHSLDHLPQQSEQLFLPFNTIKEEFQIKTPPPISTAKTDLSQLEKTRKQIEHQKPEKPFHQPFRIEIWRESKKEKKNLRIIKV